MLKLAINATSVAPGGGMTVLAGLLEGWKEIEWESKITIYASRPKVMDICRQVRPNIDVIPFALNAPSHKHFLMQQFSLGKIIAKSGANVVYSNQSAVGRCSVPQLVHHQNLKRFQFSGYLPRLQRREFSEAVKDFAAKRAMKRSACNVFISNFLKEEAVRIVPGDRYKNHVVHNGISNQLICVARRETSQWDGHPTIFALQGTAKHKDNLTLIRMMAELAKLDSETPWRLRIAGGGNWESCRKLCLELGVLDRIEFLGFLSEREFDLQLRSSCCLVFTSILEGFGLPIIESMARHCPPVACNSTALPEIVGDAGLLVSPGDATAFAKAVKKIYHDSGVRANLVENGKRRIESFAWSQAAKDMADLLESIAN